METQAAIPCAAARDLLLSRVSPVDTEMIGLSDAFGRVLASAFVAEASVPAFDRSPYDGYAIRAADTSLASRETPVTLRILEEVAAGSVPTQPLTSGTATKILTGAPIPMGADAVVMYESTTFDARSVTLYSPVRSGADIVRAGEDVCAGETLAPMGTVLDAGLIGALAGQGRAHVSVYRRPRVGVLSTGNELIELGEPLRAGAIYNSNGQTIAAALQKAGCEPVRLGLAQDTTNAVSSQIAHGVSRCDAVVLSGGVSVGDYDKTPKAMEKLGAEMLVRRIAMKPGRALALGLIDGKPVVGLPGNPSAAMLDFYLVALPMLHRLCGRRDALLPEIVVTLEDAYPRRSECERPLRGMLDLSDGTARLHLTSDQRSASIRGTIGCDAIAIIPAGSGPVAAGTKLKGYLL